MNFLKLITLILTVMGLLSCKQEKKSLQTNFGATLSAPTEQVDTEKNYESPEVLITTFSDLGTYDNTLIASEEDFEIVSEAFTQLLGEVSEDSLILVLEDLENKYKSSLLLSALGKASFRYDLEIGERILNKALPRSEEVDDFISLERIYHNLGQVNLLKVDYTIADSYFRKALAVAEQNDLERRIGSNLLTLAINAVNDLDKQKAYQYINRAEKIVRGIEDNDQLMAEYYGVLMIALSLEGRYKDALLLEDTLSRFYPQIKRDGAEYNRGVLYNYQGYYRKSNELISISNQESLEQGYTVNTGTEYLVLADNYEKLGVYDTAMIYNKLALDVFRENDIEDYVCQTKGQISLLQFKLGNKFAVNTGLDAIDCYERMIIKEDNFTLYQDQLFKVDFYSAKGDYDEAMIYADSCLKIVEELEILDLIAGVYLQQGELLNKIGKPEKAREKFESALKYGTEEEFYPIICESYFNLAKTEYDLGNYDAALKHSKDCLKLAEELEYIVIFEELLEVLANVYTKKERFKEAYEYQSMLTDIKDKLRNFAVTDLVSYYSSQLSLEKYEAEQKELKEINKVNKNLLAKSQKVVFLLLGALLAFAVIFTIYSYYSSKKIKNELRREIAGDIHDDLGALLYKLALNAHKIINNTDKDEVSKSTTIDNIASLSQTAMLSLKNIIWKTDVTPITFAEYEKIIRHFNQLIFGDKLSSPNIEIDFTGPDENRKVDNEFAFHSFKIYRELIQNVIKNTDFEDKYEIKIHWDFTPSKLQLSVRNTTHQSTIGTVSSGMGINNLNKRVAVLRGTMEISEEDNLYTTIVNLPVN